MAKKSSYLIGGLAIAAVMIGALPATQGIGASANEPAVLQVNRNAKGDRLVEPRTIAVKKAPTETGAAAAATFPVVWGFFGTPFNNNNPPDEVNTPFTGGAVGGTFSGTWNALEGNNTTLTAQLANILAGRSYINFHTVQNTGGEIRGQLVLTSEPSATMLMAFGMLLMGYLFRHRLRHGQ
jgi:hypothetical protein